MSNKIVTTATFVRVQTMADMTPRVVLDLECDMALFAKIFNGPGAVVAIASLTQEAATADVQKRAVAAAEPGGKEGTHDAPYGKQAKILRQSAFFRTPEVWRAIGADDQFLRWLRGRPCAASALSRCDGDIVAAHVRRVANGAGTGIKPEYSAVALCSKHHDQQHRQGETAFGGREWFDQRRIEAVQQWAWDTLKSQLGYQTWADIPPMILKGWAESHGIERLIPEGYA